MYIKYIGDLQKVFMKAKEQSRLLEENINN
jgi:hypothetical protein